MALSPNINNREMDKFVIDDDGNTAIRVVITGGGGSGSGGGEIIPSNTQGSPLTLDGSTAIAVGTDQRILTYVASTGGAVAMSVNPQIAIGSQTAQELYLFGTSNTSYITLHDGDGLILNGDCDLKLGSIIYLLWTGLAWAEVSRNDL